MSDLVNIVKHSGAPSNFSEKDKPTWDLYSTCIHCGLCLNHCPTYRVLGVEMDSPRGRIYQVLKVDEGTLPLSEAFVTHIDRCLGCLACETACPSGVPYGHIVERARAQIEENYPRPFFQKILRDFFFKKVLRDFHVLARQARLLRFYQQSGLQRLVRTTGVLHLFGLAKIERLSPLISKDFYFSEFGMMVPAISEKRGRVLFHAGCISNVAFADLNRDTVRLLALNGFEVYIHPHQRCCGALQAHAGYREEARLLARRNIVAAFEEGGRYDAIITNAAGCGSNLKQYPDLLKDDPQYADKAREFSSKVRDVSEFLAEVGLRVPRFRLDKRVAYQDACHLNHAQKVRSAPRELLTAVGASLVELPHPEQCCGSAGTYNVTQNDLSMKILDAKMDDVASVEADVVATGNVGCMLQLQAGIRQRGMDLPVRHVVELLNDCY